MTTTITDPTAQPAAVIEEAKRGCVDRGVGLDGKPLNRCHVYLEGATECVCKMGPKLQERRLK